MHLSAIQLDENFVTHIQVQDDAVAGIVVVLVCILGNGAGPDLPRENRTPPHSLCRAGMVSRVGRHKCTGPVKPVKVAGCRGWGGQGEARRSPSFSGTSLTSCVTPASLTPSLVLNLSCKVEVIIEPTLNQVLHVTCVLEQCFAHRKCCKALLLLSSSFKK